jgi:hypothetical protein
MKTTINGSQTNKGVIMKDSDFISIIGIVLLSIFCLAVFSGCAGTHVSGQTVTTQNNNIPEWTKESRATWTKEGVLHIRMSSEGRSLNYCREATRMLAMKEIAHQINGSVSYAAGFSIAGHGNSGQAGEYLKSAINVTGNRIALENFNNVENWWRKTSRYGQDNWEFHGLYTIPSENIEKARAAAVQQAIADARQASDQEALRVLRDLEKKHSGE